MTGRIVVGVDLSENAAVALKWAAQEAELRGATLEVIHAWDYPYIERLGHDLRSELERRASAELDRATADVLTDPCSVEVVRTIVCGSPAVALIEASSHADLLVVGSRGHGGFTGMLLGSVSEHCAQHAHCPVVIVPLPHAGT